MLDIRYIRENVDEVQRASDNKGYKVDIANLLKLDDDRRELLSRVEEIRRERNDLASKLKGGKPAPEDLERGKSLKVDLASVEEKLKAVEEDYISELKTVPNIPLKTVPVGKSDEENVVVKEWGKKPEFDFEVKNHWQIGEARGWIDKERAAKVTGARFAYLKGDLVRLQWALMQFAIDKLTDEGFIKSLVEEKGLNNVSAKPFTPVLPPLMIRTDVYDAMDRLEPSDDRYKIEGEDLWLQGSAEHVLGSMHANEIINEEDLPLRYVGYATSFRQEAGTYGKDMEGIVRMHQFDKLEMQSLSSPETSYDEHLLMIAIQEALMQELKLPYRLLNKCTADIGKPNAGGWDIDAWLPGQGKYLETHTADFMTDYQSRRLKTRLRRKDGGDVELVHTNDATAFSQRPLIAIIENYQKADGSVGVPEALRSYLGGRETI